MWIVIGLLGFYLIYRLEFRWYMVSLIRMGYNRAIVPMFLLHPISHYIIHAIAICLFCISTYCFYRINPWMVTLSPILLIISMLVDGAKKQNSRNRVIRLAVVAQIDMLAKGANQVQINNAVCAMALGPASEFDSDHDLKDLLKSYILPSLGLFTTAQALTADGKFIPAVLERHLKDREEIDRIFDQIYLELSRTQTMRI
jgi:hypothetical protein